MKIIIAFFILLLSFNSYAQNINTPEVYFGKLSGAFSVYNMQTDVFIDYNPEQCNKRYSPCSTFKIPNSLIGLETGVIDDTSFVIKYDSILHTKDPDMMEIEPFKYWFGDLSLNQAFKYSCVWYYQELARRVGNERMKKYIEYLKYGNGDISSGLDSYWLCGSIQISIREQIEFLKRMYLHKLDGFSDKTIDAVKSIMLYESTPDYKLYGKTGGGDCIDGKVIGWYVGFVETKDETYIFAMNVIVDNFSDLGNNYRINLTKRILKDLKIIN